jgi:hypothetical protein
MKTKYVLGVDPLPPEIAEKVMTYQTLSGGCGYELWGKYRTYEGHVGDLLIVTDKKMYIKRLDFGMSRDYLEPHLEP